MTVRFRNKETIYNHVIRYSFTNKTAWFFFLIWSVESKIVNFTFTNILLIYLNQRRFLLMYIQKDPLSGLIHSLRMITLKILFLGCSLVNIFQNLLIFTSSTPHSFISRCKFQCMDLIYMLIFLIFSIRLHTLGKSH